MNEIEVKSSSIKTAKRAGELYSMHLRRYKKTLKRILPDFIIGANAEKYSDALITWNPADYKIDIPVTTPVDVMEKEI